MNDDADIPNESNILKGRKFHDNDWLCNIEPSHFQSTVFAESMICIVFAAVLTDTLVKYKYIHIDIECCQYCNSGFV